MNRQIEIVIGRLQKQLPDASSQDVYDAAMQAYNDLAVKFETACGKDISELQNYMYVSARNNLIRIRKRNRRRTGFIEFQTCSSESNNSAQNYYDDEKDTDNRMTLEILLSGLPEKQAQIVRLFDIEGYLMREVALKLDMELQAAYKSRQRALKKMAEFAAEKKENVNGK